MHKNDDWDFIQTNLTEVYTVIKGYKSANNQEPYRITNDQYF